MGREDWNVDHGFLDPLGNRTNGIPCNLPGPHDPFQCAVGEGYRGRFVTYQLTDCFWLFQGIESAVFFALAAMLLGLTDWWVSKRSA